MLRTAIAAVVVGSIPRLALAEPEPGTVEAPRRVDALPYAVRWSTAEAQAEIDAYDCAGDLDESGPERVFAFELSEPAKVTAWVEGDDGIVDVDVQVLDTLTIENRIALGCAGRGNAIAEAELGAGVHYVAVDSFGGAAGAGAFVLRLDAIGSTWTERPIGVGVVWRARRAPDLAGGPQVLHALRVDLEASAWLEVVKPDDCATVAETVAGDDVVAAVNSSFFASCTEPVSFMKQDGQVLAYNLGAEARGVFGLDDDGAPIVGRVEPNADWNLAATAQGGLPLLVEQGVALQGDRAWALEGLTSASFNGPNPRTVIGYDGEGRIVLATIDGRRPSAAGMSLDALASWGADELDAVGLVNLDGGGSTTMWVRGATPNGVVNYPSDAGTVETAEHTGARAVVGAVLVHAEPYNHPPRFQTEPSLQAAVGEAYEYDADVVDLDVDDVVSFALIDPPEGMTVDDAGIVRWTPPADAAASTSVQLQALDDRGAHSDQTFTLAVEGGIEGGTTSDDGADEAGDDSGAQADEGGSTSTSAGGSTGPQADEDSSRTDGCGCATDSGPPRGSFVAMCVVWAVLRSRTRRRTSEAAW